MQSSCRSQHAGIVPRRAWRGPANAWRRPAQWAVNCLTYSSGAENRRCAASSVAKASANLPARSSARALRRASVSALSWLTRLSAAFVRSGSAKDRTDGNAASLEGTAAPDVGPSALRVARGQEFVAELSSRDAGGAGKPGAAQSHPLPLRAVKTRQPVFPDASLGRATGRHRPGAALVSRCKV